MLLTVILLACAVWVLLLKVNAHGRQIANLQRTVWELSGGAQRAAYESKWDSVRSEMETVLDEEEAKMAEEAAAKAR